MGISDWSSDVCASDLLTKSLSLDGRADNIVCSQIDIGNAATDMTERMAAGILQADGSMRVQPRMAVKQVARAVRQMAGLPLDVNDQFMTIARQSDVSGKSVAVRVDPGGVRANK